ncbi:MAG: kelch repeat-containing protein [Methanoregula sp.]
MKLFPYILITASLCLVFVPVLAETMQDTTSDSISTDTPLPRGYHTTVAFDNKMWVIGGLDTKGNRLHDVWYSTDGITWTCTNTSVRFSNPYDLRALVYDNKMWVIAAADNETIEVWNSSDGITWDLVTNTPGFLWRYGCSVLSFDNRIWVIGGEGSGWKNDVWYSTNGMNWSAANLSAAFPGRSGHTSFVFDNRMWVAGGVIGECYTTTNDVWSSPDGIIWTQAPRPVFSSNDFFNSLVYNNQIWIFRGDEVWQSGDGARWTLANASALGSWKYTHDSENRLIFNNKMWVISGNQRGYGDDVWYSTDGCIWTRADTTQRIWPRLGHSAAVFNDTLWLIGGWSRDRDRPLNDVWNSIDGAHWSKTTESAAFSQRTGQSSLVFDDKLWVIGGTDKKGQTNNEIWFTDDGTIWQSANLSAAFSPRKGMAMAVFDNNLWIIGGYWDEDVWYSADGKIRICANESLPFLTGWSQSAVVFNNRLWVAGGVFIQENETMRYEFWSTADGRTWQQVNASLPFSISSPHALTSYGGRMWIIESEGIWNSEDGMIWDPVGELPSATDWRDPVVLVYDDKIWAIGGNRSEWQDDAWFSTDGVTWTRAGDSTDMLSVADIVREDRHGDFISAMCGPHG